MSGAYPHFKLSYTHEELVEHFLVTPADLQLVWTCRGETNLCGMALLLKALTYLGYVPDSLDNVPLTIRLVPCGVIFWRSSKEDLQQPKDVGASLLTAQRRQKARPTGRRPRETR